jgi:hypothetical protein
LLGISSLAEAETAEPRLRAKTRPVAARVFEIFI